MRVEFSDKIKEPIRLKAKLEINMHFRQGILFPLFSVANVRRDFERFINDIFIADYQIIYVVVIFYAAWIGYIVSTKNISIGELKSAK